MNNLKVASELVQVAKLLSKTAAGKWAGVEDMRNTIDAMMDELEDKMESSKNTPASEENDWDDSDEGGYNFIPHYKIAISALRECSEKLRTQERII